YPALSIRLSNEYFREPTIRNKTNKTKTNKEIQNSELRKVKPFVMFTKNTAPIRIGIGKITAKRVWKPKTINSRSEERRVGKERRSRWRAEQQKKKERV